jgi:sugar phosphate isomerase/epimerase
MKLVLAGDSLTGGLSIHDLARTAAEAGFLAVELPIATQAALTPETDRSQCLETLRVFRDAGVSIAALRCDFGPQCHVAATASQTRAAAIRLIAESLQRGQWLEAELLSVSATSPYAEHAGAEVPDSAESLLRARHALSELVPDAEGCGLRLALEVPADGFLSDPAQAADVIDRVNSPWVGLRLDADACVGNRWADWLLQAGWRLAAVHLRETGELVESGECFRLSACLAESPFDGPVIVAGGCGRDWETRLAHGVDADRSSSATPYPHPPDGQS